MKKLLIIATIVLNVAYTLAGSPEYKNAMIETIKTMDSAKTGTDLMAIAGKFELIASNENTEWLPLYYAAFCYTRASFEIKEEDKRDLACDRSIELINNALKLRPSESELYTLMGFAYIAKLNVSPMMRGMTYVPKAKDFLEKGKSLNAQNPRPVYLLGTITYHSPSFMGGGRENALPQLNEALALYEKYPPADSLMPNWGKEACVQLINQK